MFDIDDEYIEKGTFYHFQEAAKIIAKKNIGRNTLFKLLRAEGWLNEFNKPIDKYIENGFLKEVNRPPDHLTVISKKGIDYVKKHLLKDS